MSELDDLAELIRAEYELTLEQEIRQNELKRLSMTLPELPE